MKKVFLLIYLVIISLAQSFGQTGRFTQAAFHYKTLRSLSASPSPERAWMDTISFPWEEYGKAALANSLLRTVYLGSEDEEKLVNMVSFPANSSDQTRAELDFLLKLQENRTSEQIGRAEYIAQVGSSPLVINPLDSLYDENLRHLFYIAEPVGAYYNPHNFPATTRLLLNCIQDIRATEFRLKRIFKRARPYHLEPRLQPLARISSPSFASGHTLWAFTQAFLFSEIIPEHKDTFLTRAEEVRWSRELLGIHFPSDNEASRVVSWNLVRSWFNNPRFVADLQTAKAEWASKKVLSKR
jgi:acid phosphatase (class A)